MATLEWVRDNYDADKDRYIKEAEATKSVTDYFDDIITKDQTNSVVAAFNNHTLLPAYTSTPPGMETRTMELEEGKSYDIQVSLLPGYETLTATIHVSSTGVTCTAGPCNTQGPPGVTTSGWTVTTYLKEGAAATNRCGWIATKDTSKVVFISEMVLAYNNLVNIGFTPTAAEIGNAVLMYSNLGTPDSLWGC